MAPRHYTSVTDLTREEASEVLELAARLKYDWNVEQRHSKRLRGQTLAMIFEKPSLRTRVTFEAGMTQLGGHAIFLGPADIQLGRRESVADAARSLSRWVQLIMARTFEHATIRELAAYSRVPVINGLSDQEHPCQALADALTLEQYLGRLQGRRVAWIGDGNNVAQSLMLMCAMLGAHTAVATPEGYRPAPEVVERARALAAESDAELQLTHDPYEAVRGADAVVTDVWASMGQEAEAEARRPIFAPYRVTNELLEATGKPETIFLHCLPAHRGEEVVAEVIDGPRSVVLDEAENRLHAQKALILWLLGRE